MKISLKLFFSLMCGVLLLSMLAGCSGGGGGGGGTRSGAAALVSLEITPNSPSMASGTTKQFMATGIYSDNTSKDLTSSVTWTTSDSTVAVFSSTTGTNGLVTSVATGSATVTATSGTISGTTNLTVTTAILVSIEVTPTDPSIAMGTTQQFTATGIYTDNTRQNLTATVTWSPSDAAVATVGSNGMATSVAPGSTTITATSGTISGSTNLTVTSATLVSIELTPTMPSIAPGTTQQFMATGIFDDSTIQDLTTQVAWTSSNTAVATLSSTPGSSGLATAVGGGQTTITATLLGKSGTTDLTVTSAKLVSMGVTPPNPSIALGRTEQLTATGIFDDNTVQDLTTQVVWSSSTPTVATVSNAQGSYGLATSAGTGQTTITATLGTVSGSTDLTVSQAVLQSIDITPAIPTIAKGTTQQFIAMGTYSDNTTVDLTQAVLWSSSTPTVATISNDNASNGLATSFGTGQTTISATLGIMSGSTILTVGSATLQSIDVVPTNPSIPMGLTQQFTASGNYSDGTVQDLTSSVTWTSSDVAIASISNAAGSNGLAIPINVGSATINATFVDAGGTITGSTVLTVTSATLQSITITPATPQIAMGTSLQFTATGAYSDGSTQDLTSFVAWTSTDGSVATISDAGVTRGLATSVGAGQTTITASLGTVTPASVTLAVTNATLQTITITPANSTIFLGAPQQFTATGNFSDSTKQDLTTQVAWRSSNKTIASISNAVGSNGVATPLKAGSTTISATMVIAGAPVTGTTGLAVSSATLQSITVTPNPANVAVKKTKQFKATGNYGNGLTQDLTTSVNLTWTSSNTAVATVVNVPKKNKGLATGVSAGSTTIKATLRRGAGSGTFGSSTLTVN